jgi:uncharacterized metal-binding protein YceD (DUF177 family)
MSNTELSEQEWSHFFDIRDLKDGKTKITIEASEEELHDMARRLGVLSIQRAKADLVFDQKQGGRTIHVNGKFEVKITQNCVVTLEDFESVIKDSVVGWFADKAASVSFAAAKREKEAAVSRGEVEMVDEEEDPEPIIDNVIDLGELVTQHISLAIPPYPHKEGVKYENGDDNIQIDDKSPLRRNPFEALKDWKETR